MRITPLIKLACVLVLPLALNGCFTLPDSDSSRGVKLSDAMNSSASGDHRDLGGIHSDDNSSSPGVDLTILGGASGGGDISGVTYDKNEYSLQIPFDVSYAQPINSDFQGLTHFTLTPLAFEDEENMFGLYIGGAKVDLKSGSLPDRAVDRTWMLETGLTYRRYLNSSRPAFSPYFTASVGYALLSWSYRNQIFAGGDAYQSDSLNAAEGSLAFGISTRRDKHLSLYGEVGIGGMAFTDVTNHGFDNDVFHAFGFVSFKAGLTVKF